MPTRELISYKARECLGPTLELVFMVRSLVI